MLQEILDYIHNYFVKEVHTGTFKIESGSLDVDFLQNNQYFRIMNSVFNDGVHKYSSEDELTDETFEGVIQVLAIPKAILNVETEVNAWLEANGDVINSPYQSESFGGYSYTKGTGSGKNGSTQISWQDKFGAKLNAYRKIS